MEARLSGNHEPIKIEIDKVILDELRTVLDEQLVLPAELDSFCNSYFPPIARQFKPNMSRTDKTNLLLAEAEPDAIIDRQKQGFGVPVQEWMQGRLGALMQDTLTEFCDRTDILSKDAVLDLVCRQRDPRSWYLFNLALWWKAYLA